MLTTDQHRGEVKEVLAGLALGLELRKELLEVLLRAQVKYQDRDNILAINILEVLQSGSELQIDPDWLARISKLLVQDSIMMRNLIE